MIPAEVKSAIDYPVPEHANRLGYSLGGITLAIFGLLFASGVVLAYFGYQPSLQGAHESMLYIEGSPLLSVIRSAHSLSAELFMILIILHATRIVLTKSYHGARRMTWNAGIVLLVISAALFFSGTVLKWDQEGYEAFSHVLWVNGMLPLGGLINDLFFSGNLPKKLLVVHAILLPMLFLLVTSLHLIYVKILKISPLTPAQTPPAETSRFSRHLVGVAGYSLIVFGVIAIASAFYTPPLLDAPYEGVEWTRPPWLFMFIYTLENWFGMWVLPVLPPVILLCLLGLPSFSQPTEKWDFAQFLYFALLAIIMILILIGALSAPAEHMM